MQSAVTFASSRPLTRTDYRTLALSALGGALEYYDFVIFVFFARSLGQLFFPAQTADWLRQLQIFAIFAVGYFVRPLGGILIAHLGDLLGRKRTFTFSILMMAIATLGIGLLPVYSQAGVWAPLALIFLRAVQGAALGGEMPGAWVFVAEHVPPNRVGFACATLTAGLSAGVLLGSTVAAILTTAFTSTEISNWAWRTPFILGGLLGLCSVYLRQFLQETPIFAEMRERKSLAAELPLKIVVRDHIGSVVVSILLSGSFVVLVAVIALMTPTLLQTIYGISMAAATRANSVATLCGLIGFIAGGTIIDRWGAGPVLVLGNILLGVGAWLFYTEGTANASLLMPLYGLTSLFVGIVGSAPAYFKVRAFPAAIRFSGLSFSYNVATAVFGGLTPLLISSLLPWVHLVHVYCVLAACALGWAVGIGLWRSEQGTSSYAWRRANR